MQTFDDFIISLDNEEFRKELDEISRMEIVQGDFSPESIGKTFEMIYQRAASDAVRLSLLYLRKYHEWLSEQI